MKVKFINDYIIYRAPVWLAIKLTVQYSYQDMEEEQIGKMLEKVGWPLDVIDELDKVYVESKLEDEEIDTDIENATELYNLIKKYMDLSQFWGMK
jgi:hypothetical protein